MGINYGDTRNRSEDLHALPGVVLEGIGDYDLNYEKFDWIYHDVSYYSREMYGVGEEKERRLCQEG